MKRKYLYDQQALTGTSFGQHIPWFECNRYILKNDAYDDDEPRASISEYRN